MSAQYEVLNPWAEADEKAVPKGISPRLTDLEGKTIGLFSNSKAASLPILRVVEARLRERYPALKFSLFELVAGDLQAAETNPEDKAEFEEWVKGVDAVVGAVGD